jgi:hypothetical protein
LIGRPRHLWVFQLRGGIWGRSPRVRRRRRRSWASSPFSVAMTWSRSRARPCWPGRTWRGSSSGMAGARASPCAGVGRADSGRPAPAVRRWMRLPCPFRPGATPAPPPWPGGKGAVEGPVRPVTHPALLGQPQQAGLQGREGAIGLPALQPPVCGTLGGPWGAVGGITPAAAGEQDVASRMHHWAQGRLRQTTTPLRRFWRQEIGNERPLQRTEPLESSGHRPLLENWRVLEHRKYLSGIGSGKCAYI